MKWLKQQCACGQHRQADAPTDVALHVLEELQTQGYTDAVFRAGGGSCRICKSHDGEQRDLEDVIDSAEYDAAVYTWAGHCGCKSCFIIVMGEDLPNVRVNYAGRA